MSNSPYVEAMEVRTQAEADAVFKRLVAQCMKERPCNQTEAEHIQRENLGYFSGYYDQKTQARVERLYRCAHPIFGPISDNGRPTSEQAFQTGMMFGRALRKANS